MSLVELLVVMAVSSVLVGVVTSLLVSLQQWDRKLRDHSVQREQVLRLAESIRADLRQATDVRLDDHGTLVISLPDGVEWRYGEGLINKTKSAESVDTFSIGTFEIGQSTGPDLDIDNSGRRRLVTVTLTQHDGDDGEEIQTVPLLVSAVLGGDAPAAEDAQSQK